MNKRFIAFILTVAMLLGCFSTSFAASREPRIADPGKIVPEVELAQGGSGFGEIEGSKTAEETGEGEYEITLSVPGIDSEVDVNDRLYNEVIIMVDGSDSQSDRTGNFSSLKVTLKDIGDALLTEDGHTHLTLMGFGFSAKTVMSISTPSELDSLLKALNQDDLLYGVSATNCESGFVHIDDYLNNSPNLNEAVVVFTSDGQTNLDEEPWDWSRWKVYPDTLNGKSIAYPKKTYRNYDPMIFLQGGLEIQRYALLAGADFLDATLELYPEECAAITQARADYETLQLTLTTPSAITDDEGLKKALDDLDAAIMATPAENSEYAKYMNGAEWVDAVWEDVFEEYGLEYGTDCLEIATDCEHAMMEYFYGPNAKVAEEYQGFENTVFLGLYGNLGVYQKDYYSGNTEYGFRAVAACNKLVGNDKVKNLYLIGYPGNITDAHWMNPEASVENKVAKNAKVDYFASKDFKSALVDLAEQVEATIVKTPINDPVVTDPMSKWVDLDEDSITITRDGEPIWTATEGWLISENEQPVAGDPIQISYDAETGKPVITWMIKDGALVITDRYAMVYTVNMDTDAEGYIPGTEYPLNDPTDVTYINEDNKIVKVDIEVPEGKTPGCNVIVNYYLDGSDTKLDDSVETEPAAKYSDYDVTELHKDEIIKDGIRYVLVRADGDDETGTLDSDKVVNLYFRQPTVIPSRPVVTGGTDDEEEEVKEEILPVEQPAEEPEEVEEEVEEVVENIEETETPLADAPEVEEEYEEMPEEDVPLADVPATGENTVIWAMIALVSACLMMAWTVISRRKEN